MAKTQARDNLNKDLVTRLWVTKHGGIYVPLTDRTPANPHLAHIPDRNIVKPSGDTLTLMDPTSVVRQMQEEFSQLYGKRGQITSLKPLRTENVPKEWERRALQEFERGKKEVFEFNEIDGEEYLQIIQPIYTKKGCLKCHDVQDYKVGDIQGGVGISVPMSPFYATAREHRNDLILWHFLLFVFGIAGIHLGSGRILKSVKAKETAEKALNESEERLKFALRVTQVGLWDWQVQTGETVFDNRWAEIAGYTLEELAPVSIDTWNKLAHPDDLKKSTELCERHFNRETEYYVFESRLRHKNGNWIWVSDRGKVVSWDENGKPVRMIGTRYDITDIKNAEKESLLANQQLKQERDLFVGGPVVVFKWRNEENWPVEYVSVNSKNVFGYTDSEFIRGSVSYLEIIHPEDLVRFTNEVVTNSESGNRYFEHQPYRIMHKTNKEVWVLDYTTVITNYKGEITHYLGYIVDITEQKDAEVERLNLERQIQHSQKLESLGVLAGGIAHDFNNLLTAILGNADLALLNLSPLSPAKKNINHIISATRSAADLANQMLGYSGKGRFVIESIKLAEIVREMSHLLEASISKNVLLKYDFADDVPPIEADPTQIRQIIMNLITNASEAVGGKNGVISISTGKMVCDDAYLTNCTIGDNIAGGQYSYLEVSDTGCGMDDEEKQKIFDPFYSTKFTGRGLGMAVILGIVRGHRGAIKVYSELNKGTTIKVLFPASLIQRDPNNIIEINEQIKPDRFTGKILLVDDEESVRVVASEMLKMLGFTVLTARDGQEALDVLWKNQDEVKLVILDLTMPRMDGEQTLCEIRRVRTDIPVIISSGYNEQNIAHRFTGKGLAGFIQKPFRLNKLISVIQKALSNR